MWLRGLLMMAALVVIGGCGIHDHRPERDKTVILYDPDYGTPVAAFYLHQDFRDGSSITLLVQNISGKEATFNFTLEASAPGSHWQYDGACVQLPSSRTQDFGEISRDCTDLNSLTVVVSTYTAIIYFTSSNG